MSYGTTRASPAEQNGSNTAPSSQSLGGASGSSSDPAVADQDSHGNSLRLRAKAFYSRNLGLVFVFLAQIFASIMSMTTRLLATGFEPKIHALQIIFVRMLATALIGSFWMWFKKVPGFPLGPRGVRRLLVIRGVAGSVGLFGLYYSLSYLDVSEATVITFLVPTITAFVCWVALHEPFTLSEALAGLIALVGVVFIARPTFLFPPMGRSEPHALVDGATEPHFRLKGGLLPPVRASPLERSIAVGCAIAGAFCAATAYATIRIIGKRAHSLVSVNYFASTATVSSFLIIMLHPSLQFEIPTSLAQWLLLLSIGLSGFIFQILITEGLQREKAGRATNLIYTQLIFSLIIDYTVWGTTPPATSIAGSILIIGAAVWISVQKKTTPEKRQPSTVDEESRLLPSEGPRT